MMIQRSRATVACLCLVLVLSHAGPGAAQGLLIPSERDLPPLAMRSHLVTVEVDHQTAVTRVEQVFENNTDRALEATYVFPVPAGAVMSSFALEANGVMKKGELMDRDMARHLYGLGLADKKNATRLDEGKDGAFKATIYPVPAHGVQTLKLTFTHVLQRDGGLVWFEYPVPNGSASLAGAAYQFHIEGRVKAPQNIKSVYSPSHPLTVDRPAPAEAKFHLDRTTPLDRSLKVAYTVSDKDVGIDLVTHRPDPSEPGYFMVLVSPGSARAQARRAPRDVVFVLDRSGSMAGEKMDQARRALKFCVKNLEDGDRFDILTFSTESEAWRGQLASAKTERAAAETWIDAIQPEGGTNVHAALTQALAYPRDPGRTPVVVFFTDGKPTLGDTVDSGALLQVVAAKQAAGGPHARIFTWGLGYDLDAQLLDRLAEENGGVSEYVEPGEDLAAKVEAFHRKSAHPVLSDLSLSVDPSVQLVATYPRRLPELYAGGVLVVLGRYKGQGQPAIKLTGRLNGVQETFEATGTFPEASAANPFVGQLWARRHIGHLLDAIREKGERRELVDKVVELSSRHGVQTPYTSWLVRDGGAVVAAVPVASQPLLASSGPIAVPAGSMDLAAAPADSAMEEKDARADELHDGIRAFSREKLQVGLRKFDGQAGVAAARYLGSMKLAQHAEDAEGTIFAGAQRRFSCRGPGLWYDTRFDSSCAITPIRVGGRAEARIRQSCPDIVPLLDAGGTVIVVTGLRRAVMVGYSGRLNMSDGELDELFRGTSD